MDYTYLKKWKKDALERTGGRGKFLADLLLTPPTGENDVVFDLHIHDDGSDGSRSAEGVFQEAANNKLKYFATANHDVLKTQKDYYSYQIGSANYRGEYLNGIEITSRLNGYPIEVLVYDYDLKKATRLADSQDFPFLNREFKLKRILTLCDKRLKILNEKKILDRPLNFNDFIALEVPKPNGGIKYVPFRELNLDAYELVLQKGEIKEEIEIDGKKYKVNFDNFNSKFFKYVITSEKGRALLNEKGIEIDEANLSKVDLTSLSNPSAYSKAFSEFNRDMLQAKTGLFHVDDDEWWPTVEEVVEFAKKTGGVAVFAHPFGYNKTSVPVEPEKLMQMAYEAGVDGIECMHGFNRASQVEKIYNFCKERGLLISAGSDTHGYYSNQGDKTEPGVIPGAGFYADGTRDFIDNIKCSLFNLHYIGSGKYKELEAQPEK